MHASEKRSSLEAQPESTHLKDRRLDALANLVPYVDVSGHFGQDIGPEGWLLRSSPAEGWRVPGCVLQLHATQENMSARDNAASSTDAHLETGARLVPAARAGASRHEHCRHSKPNAAE